MISVPTQTRWKLLGGEGGVLAQRWMMDGCRAVVGGGGGGEGGRRVQHYHLVTLLQGGKKPFRALWDVWIRWRHCHSTDTQKKIFFFFYRQKCCSVSLLSPKCLTPGSGQPVIERAHQSGFVPYLGFSKV